MIWDRNAVRPPQIRSHLIFSEDLAFLPRLLVVSPVSYLCYLAKNGKKNTLSAPVEEATEVQKKFLDVKLRLQVLDSPPV